MMKIRLREIMGRHNWCGYGYCMAPPATYSPPNHCHYFAVKLWRKILVEGHRDELQQREDEIYLSAMVGHAC